MGRYLDASGVDVLWSKVKSRIDSSVSALRSEVAAVELPYILGNTVPSQNKLKEVYDAISANPTGNFYTTLSGTRLDIIKTAYIPGYVTFVVCDLDGPRQARVIKSDDPSDGTSYLLSIFNVMQRTTNMDILTLSDSMDKYPSSYAVKNVIDSHAETITSLVEWMQDTDERLDSYSQVIQSNIESISDLNSNLGNPAELTTANKSSLVAAVNEVNGKVVDCSARVSGISRTSGATHINGALYVTDPDNDENEMNVAGYILHVEDMVNNMPQYRAGTNITFTEESDGVFAISATSKPMTSVTYATLKAYRNAGTLVPGMQYRITDYACTTSQENTQSAGHQFDIIVTADSSTMLNENARAVRHAGDTYFANSKLEAWELKYSIDNDADRFAWANINGKGVIYYMKDEFDNECPYDFKNIMFNGDWGYYAYTFNWINDESGNSCEDLSVAQFAHLNDEGGYSHTYGNIIKPYGDNLSGSNGLPYRLNFIVFLAAESDDGGLCYGWTSNIFGYDCRFNTFGYNCFSNTFGDMCYSNTFGHSCYSNTFGHSCYSNTFGNDCNLNALGSGYSNTFGNSCESNTFGENCVRNTFGNGCHNNIFENGCQSNTFGNDCTHNTFGNRCDSNTFGHSCYRNTAKYGFSNNTFGNSCHNNTFGNSCHNNTFGGDFVDNIFGNSCESNTFGENCNRNTLGDFCSDNTFGIGCYYNIFGSRCRSNTFGVDCHNNILGLKCVGNIFENNCGHNTFLGECEYNKIGIGCYFIILDSGCIKYSVIDPGVTTVNIYAYSTTSNYHVRSGVKECHLELDSRQDYQDQGSVIPVIEVGINSKGEIVMFCLEDLYTK